MLQSTLPRHESTSPASERLRLSAEKFWSGPSSISLETAPSPAPAVGGVLGHALTCTARLKQKDAELKREERGTGEACGQELDNSVQQPTGREEHHQRLSALVGTQTDE